MIVNFLHDRRIMIAVKYNVEVFAATIFILLFAGVCVYASTNDDAIIAKKIKDVLLNHDNVSAIKTKISVKDGIVTLQGEADSQAQKDLTEEYVDDDVKGVKSVKNEMTVKGEAEKPVKTIYNIIDDASITSRIKTSLLVHKSTSILTTVETKDGVVTLSGKVKNAAEKDLVAKLASDIEGVKKVINNLTVE